MESDINRRVSVIVPVYNAEPFLRRCLDSILAQSFDNFECILVDDASPDGCPAICDEYARKDARFIVVHKPVNQGSPQARKTGLKKATGDFVLFVDSDDWVDIRLLEKVYAQALAGNYDMVCFDWDRDFGKYREYNKNDPGTDKILLLKKLLREEVSHSCCTRIARRSLYETVYHPQGHMGDDWVVAIQLVWLADKIGYVPEDFYHYYQNPASLPRDDASEKKGNEELRENWAWVVNFFREKMGDQVLALEPELSAYTALLENEQRGMYAAFKNCLPRGLRVWCRKAKRFFRRFTQ